MSVLETLRADTEVDHIDLKGARLVLIHGGTYTRKGNEARVLTLVVYLGR